MKENIIKSAGMFMVDCINYKGRKPGDAPLEFLESKPLIEVLKNNNEKDIDNALCHVNKALNNPLAWKLWEAAVDVCVEYGIKLIYMFNSCKYVVDSTSQKYLLTDIINEPGFMREYKGPFRREFDFENNFDTNEQLIEKLRLKQFGPHLPHLTMQYYEFVMKTNAYENTIKGMEATLLEVKKCMANHKLKMYMKLAKHKVDEIDNAEEFKNLTFVEKSIARRMQGLIYGCFDYFGFSDIILTSNSLFYLKEDWEEIMNEVKYIILNTTPESFKKSQIDKIVDCFNKYNDRKYPDSDLYVCFNEFRHLSWKI